VIETLELAALALPVADRVFNKLELRSFAEVGYRKHRAKHCLKAGVLTLGRKHVHLKKAIVGLTLYLDQVWNPYSRLDPRKIVSLPAGADSRVPLC
jgi:hypothetical protein